MTQSPREPTEWLGHARALERRSQVRGPDCLSDDTVAALAEGSLDPATRSSVLPHLAACGYCRAAVASIARALADPPVRDALAVAEGQPGRGRRLLRYLVPAAAAAVIALLLIRPDPAFEGSPDRVHRAPAASARPAAVAPIGPVAAARELVWTTVTGADRYRLILYDAGGSVLYEALPNGDRAGLPDSVSLAPGRRYLWKVEARIGFDRWVASDLVEFVIQPAPLP